ncbi:MAG: cell division protein FtsQ/DivIB [Jatrophihabitantaceae bacterium]
MSATPPTLRRGAVDGDEPDVGIERSARSRRLVVIAVGAGLVAAVLTWVVAYSPVLGANNLRVRGTHNLTVAQVRAAAAIKHGIPLVRLDTAAVARRVEALPDVASATVRAAYPSSVIITVTERVPVGYVISDPGWVLVDKTGDQYRRVGVKPRALPLFVVPAGANAKAAGEAVATVAASLAPPLLARVASVQAFDPTAITLLLVDRRVVRWGTADRSVDKAKILPILLSQPGSRFDVTDPDQVVTH